MSAMSIRAAVLILGLSLCSAAAQAGGSRVGFSASVPFGLHAGVPGPGFASSIVPAPMHPAPPVHAPGFVRPPLAPVFFSPFVPGFVTFAPPVVVVVTTTGPVTVIAPPPVAVFPPLAVVPPAVMPHVPVISPSSPLFFAPPVRTFAPAPAGGAVIFIRSSGF